MLHTVFVTAGKHRVLIACCGLFLVVAGAAIGLERIASRADPEALRGARQRIGFLSPDERAEIGALAVVDFSRPGWQRRLALYDEYGALMNTYLVAHARESGGYVFADRFSNEVDSNQSSLGLYLVVDVYEGEHGTALRLEGLDPGLNDNAMRRDIVVHGADYVSFGSIIGNTIKGNGPGVGRSLGCPAVSREAMSVIAATLTEGGYLYIHH